MGIMKAERSKRGRLSAIEQLPASADPAVAWAITQIQERRLQQRDILDGLNKRLAAFGLGPISHSGFNRWVLRSFTYGFTDRDRASTPTDTAPECLVRCPHCGAALATTKGA
jgi:hypothetical protein